MRIELSCHDLDIKEVELKNYVVEASKYQPDYISIFSYYTKLIKKISSNHFNICCPIDYPLGISDLKTRQNEISIAIKNGATKVDVVIPILYLINRKYDKFREDIKSNTDICAEAGIDINYMLEYRIFNHLALTKMVNILKENSINTIYASTGYMLDDISDNAIANMYLAQKTGIRSIINGNIWKKDQIQNIIKYKPYGLRLKNLHSLQLWYDHKNEKK